jgi:hypothetical protein
MVRFVTSDVDPDFWLSRGFIDILEPDADPEQTMNRFRAIVILLIGQTMWSSAPILAATASSKTLIVPKWGQFERSFTSSSPYTNALQEASLRVVFTSPAGETVEVPGFWDGGKTWRVRFSPDLLGRWTYATYCSDAANAGLHQQNGGFLCAVNTSQNPLNRHGPVRVARDGRYMEHADGTPYFLTADTVLEGAIKSTLRDWEIYGNTRALQGFNAAVWAAGPGTDAEGETGFAGYSDSAQVNPSYFRRLDERLEALRQAGLVSVIIPFSDVLARKEGGAELRGDQIGLLLRYLVARWDSSPVIWLLPVDGEELKTQSTRWKQVGKDVFGQGKHAPLIVRGRMHGTAFDFFRDEPWVKIFGSGVETVNAEELAKELAVLGFLDDRELKPEFARPVIPFLPEENSVAGDGGKRVGDDLVRNAACWTLLGGRPSGLCYAAFGISEWRAAEEGQSELDGVPLWRRALYLPGAKQVCRLAEELGKLPFWTLNNNRKVLKNSPVGTPRALVAASSADDGMLVVAYSPQGEPIRLETGTSADQGKMTWLNARTGGSTTDTGPIGTELTPPDKGDWLVIVKGNR